jgi:hypothetical protein
MKEKLALAVSFLIVLLYASYNYFFSVNFPFQDDFLLIQFIQTISDESLGAWDILRELFKTFNDHKAVVPRFIALVEYVLTGTLNFRFYLFLVTVNIIYIFYFLYLQFRKTKLPVYYFLPALFLYFHPLYHDISGWALNGMQHTFLTAFTVTALIFAGRKSNFSLALAIICCFLATFTHGNGILSYPALVFYFLCIKDFRKAGIIVLAMFVSLGVYMMGYESGQATHLPDDAVTFITSLFGFIGSQVSLWGRVELWSTLFGIVICISGLLLVFRIVKHYKRNESSLKPGVLELLSLLVFIFITSLVIAVFRSWAGTTITSRFQLYTCMSTVIFYIFLLNYLPLFRKRLVLAGMIGISMFYWLYSFYSYTGIVAKKRMEYQADLYNWLYTRTMFSVPRPLLENADFYMAPAYENGIFSPPAPPVSKQVVDSLIKHSPESVEHYETYLEVMELGNKPGEYERYYFLSGCKLPSFKPFFADRYLVLWDPATGESYLKNGTSKVEARKVIITEGKYYKPGFSAFFRPDDLRPGTYRLAILDIDPKGEMVFHKIDQHLLLRDGAYYVE